MTTPMQLGKTFPLCEENKQRNIFIVLIYTLLVSNVETSLESQGIYKQDVPIIFVQLKIWMLGVSKYHLKST